MATISNNQGNIVSTSLSSGYVYYEDLANTQLTLYSTIKSRLNKLAGTKENPINMSETISRLKNMSENELAKEKSFLQNIFGHKINYDYSSKEGIKQIISALNQCLSTEDIYKRVITRISSGEDSKINISEFFASYFNSQIDSMLDNIINKAKGNWKNPDMIQKIIDDEVDAAVIRAIEKMFSSQAFKSDRNFLKENPDFNNELREYQFLLNAIGSFKTSNSFASQLYNLYDFDSVKKALQENIKSLSNKRGDKGKALRKKSTDNIKDMVSKDKNQRKGSLEEYLSSLLAREVGKIKGVRVESRVTGGELVKPDIISTYNISGSKLFNTLQRDDGQVNRTINAQKIKEGYQKLEKDFKGENAYIVYTNAKNYTLTKKDEDKTTHFSGFGAGASGSIEFLRTVLSKVQDPNAVATVLGAMKQMANGAIGNKMGDVEEAIENQLASDIAYFLFDDYEIVGQKSSSNLHQLHIMDLDGLYLPLSFFLYLLADAYGEATMEVTKNPSSLVSVNLSHPEIRYPYQFPNTPPGGWTQEQWKRQKQDSEMWQIASIKFLRNFEDIVRQLLYE